MPTEIDKYTDYESKNIIIKIYKDKKKRSIFC